MRRLTRLTNGFEKTIKNHAAMVALHFMHYNFVRSHKSLRVTPAMQVGRTSGSRRNYWRTTIMTYEEIAAGILDVVKVWDHQQKPLMDFCERAKLIYRTDEFIDSETIKLLRYGLDSTGSTERPGVPEMTVQAPMLQEESACFSPPTRRAIGYLAKH